MGFIDTLKQSGVDALKQGTDKVYGDAVNAAGIGTGAAGVSPAATQAQNTGATAQNGTQASPVSPMSFLSSPRDLWEKAQANPVVAIIAVLVVGGAIWYGYRKFVK